jgi:hypothetical protein
LLEIKQLDPRGRLAVQGKVNSVSDSRDQKSRGLDGLERDKIDTLSEAFVPEVRQLVERQTGVVQHLGGNLYGQPGLGAKSTAGRQDWPRDQ